MKFVTFASALALFAVPAAAYAQDAAQPATTDDASPLDTLVPADNAPEAAAAPVPTGNPVLDRLTALEARIHQLESRNAELEEQAAETQTRVQNVEVRAAKGVQPGVVPVFADVNDNFSFKPRGMLQLDYAAYGESRGGYEFSNGTDIRRARFGFEGTAFKRFKWRLDAEYIKQQVNLLDAYISYAFNPKWSVTVGQQKAPYGLEANTSDAVNIFAERSLGSNIFGAVAAERRVGVAFAYNSDKLNATVGVFGGGEGVTRNADTAATVGVTAGAPSVTPAKAGTHDEPFSFNGRVTWEPISDVGKVLHLGVSGYHIDNLPGNAATLSDRPNSRVDGGNLISVALSGSNSFTGVEGGVKAGNYVGAEGAVVWGPFSVQGEYGALALTRYGQNALNFSGFNVVGSFFLTGESRSFKGGNIDKLKPFNDFAPSNGHYGAVELAARYDQINLNDPTLAVPTSATASATTFPGGRTAHTFTGAVNWYLNANLRAAFNYVHFIGRNSALVAPTAAGVSQVGTSIGDVFTTRLQLDF